MDCAFAISGYCFACFEFRAEGALKPVWFRLVRVMLFSIPRFLKLARLGTLPPGTLAWPQ